MQNIKPFNPYKQYPVPIDLSEFDVPDILLSIPEEATKEKITNEYCVEFSMSYADIKRKFGVDAILSCAGDIVKKRDFVYSTKIAMIESAINDLLMVISDDYKKKISEWGTDKVSQFVLCPICFLELAPGDTTITGRVFTVRELRKDE